MAALDRHKRMENRTVKLRRYLVFGALGGLLIITILTLTLLIRNPPMSKRDGPQTIRTWAAGNSITSITFSPDDKLLAIGLHDGSIELRRVSDSTILHTLKGHSGEVSVVAFSPSGQLLASGEGLLDASNSSEVPSQEAAIRLWSVQDGMLLHTLAAHKLAVAALAFSPDGQLLASDGDDKLVRLWTTANGQMRSEFNGPQAPFGIFKLVFSPDGRILTVGDIDATVQQWSLPKGDLLQSYKHPEFHGGPSRGLDISRDGQILVGANYVDPEVLVWQLGNDQLLSKYRDHRTGVGVLALSPDSQWVASTGGYRITGSDESRTDRAIHIWETNNARKISVLDGFEGLITSLVWSSDSRLLASGSHDGTVKLWQVK